MGNHNRFLLTVAMAVTSLASIVSCTSQAPTSQVRIALPEISKLSSRKALTAQSNVQTIWTRVMINVADPSGSAAPKVYIWDRHSDDLSVAPPQIITFDQIPRGSPRLVQVLLITRDIDVDSAGKIVGRASEVFNYGDVSVVPQTDVVPADVYVSSIFTGSTDESGSISGRYLDATGTGPTGLVDIKYTPPSRPDNPMIVTQAEIHGGWFDFIHFDSIPFSYWMKGVQLLPKTPDVGSTTARVKMVVPAGAFKFNNSAATAIAAPINFYLGYFGPGSTGKSMCYNSTGVLNNFFTSSSGTTKFTWSGATNGSVTLAGIAEGGVATAAGACPTGAQFVDWIGFNSASFNDSHGMLGFRGPYRRISTAQPTLLAAAWDAGTTNVKVNWSYLPDATGAGRVGGSRVFYRVLDAVPANNGKREYEVDSGFACDRLTDSTFLAKPFTAGPITLATDAKPTEALVPITNADFSSGKTQIVLCPFSDPSKLDYFTGGIDYGSGGGGGGNSQQPQATRMAIHSLGSTASPAQVGNGTCYPIVIDALDASGNPSFAAGRTLNASITGPTANFYTDQSCSGSGSPSLSVNLQDHATVYVKATSIATGTITVTDTTAAPFAAVSLPVNVIASVTATQVAAITSPNVMTYSCQTISYQLQDATGIAASTSGMLTVPTIANVTFYPASDNQCSSTGGLHTPDTNFMGAGASTITLHYMLRSATAVSNVNFGTTVNSLTAVPTYVNFKAPGAATSLSVSMGNFISGGQCQPVNVGLFDTSQNAAPNTSGSPLAVTLTASSGQFYANNTDCTGSTSPITSTSIANNEASSVIYFRQDTPGSGISISGSATGYASQPQTNITVGPAVANRVTIVLPGQGFDSQHLPTGTATSQTAGTPFTIQFYAVTPLNTLDTTFNQPLSNIGFTFPAGTSQMSFSWSNGIGTLSMLASTPTSGTGFYFNTGGGMLTNFGSSPLVVLPQVASTSVWALGGVARGFCLPLLVATSDFSGGTTLLTPSPQSINMAGGTAQMFYTNAACTTPLTSNNVSISAGQSAALAYMAVNETSTPGTLNITGTAGGLSQGSWSISEGNLIGAGVAASLRTLGATNFKNGACQAYAVTTVDSNMNPVAVTAQASVTVALPSGMHAYTNSSCTAAVMGFVYINSGESAAIFYVRSDYPTSGSISVNAAGLGNSSTGINAN